MRGRWIGLLALFVAQGAHALKLNDFAYGAEIKSSGDNALVELTLSPDVYRAATRADLGDLRVFNAEGAVVPHILRLPPTSSSRTIDRPPVFPVYASSGQTADSVVMTVKHDAQGRLARIETRRAGTGARRIVAYVVDASAIAGPVSALELEWSPVPDFMGAINVHASDDLGRWKSVVADAGIASMKFGGELLERRRIEFAPQQAKYYRVSWPADKPLPDLPVVKLEGVPRVAPPVRVWEKIALRPDAEPGQYVLAPHGQFPADRARVQLLPPTNRVVQATLSTRDRAQDAWSNRASGSVYRLTFGTLVLDSPDLVMTSASSKEWKLRLTPAEGLESVQPSIEFGWVPHRLVFVATGKGPFQLAYGAVGVTPIEGPLNGVLADVEKSGSPATVSAATLGAQTELGGSKRLAPSMTANWRTWVLWIALLAAVSLLGWMAWRLWRRMASET
jgi:hypothetical protein